MKKPRCWDFKRIKAIVLQLFLETYLLLDL